MVHQKFKVRGVFEGVDGTPLTPNATFTVTSGTFQEHETVIGQTSDARAKLITLNGDSATNYFYYLTEERFVDSEVIAGATTSATATLSNVSEGSPDIKDRYFFDDGQRDGFYDLAKLTLKTGEPTPQNYWSDKDWQSHIAQQLDEFDPDLLVLDPGHRSNTSS